MCSRVVPGVNVAADFTSVVQTRKPVRLHDGRKVRRYIHTWHKLDF
jgi:hypothetical protein